MMVNREDIDKKSHPAPNLLALLTQKLLVLLKRHFQMFPAFCNAFSNQRTVKWGFMKNTLSLNAEIQLLAPQV